jgi:hypothetical protein
MPLEFSVNNERLYVNNRSMDALPTPVLSGSGSKGIISDSRWEPPLSNNLKILSSLKIVKEGIRKE